jgi:hypothetical protein
VTLYRIKFRKAAGDFAELPGNACTSSVDTVVSCTFLMSLLTASPFNLNYGDLIISEVEAMNARGYSVPSLPNFSSITVKTPPLAGPVLSRGALSSETQTYVDWTFSDTSPANGGSAITGYNLYLFNGVSYVLQ